MSLDTFLWDAAQACREHLSEADQERVRRALETKEAAFTDALNAAIAQARGAGRAGWTGAELAEQFRRAAELVTAGGGLA